MDSRGSVRADDSKDVSMRLLTPHEPLIGFRFEAPERALVPLGVSKMTEADPGVGERCRAQVSKL